MNSFHKQLIFITLGVAIITAGGLGIYAVANRGANPVLWLKMDEGYASSTYDASGNSNTGTITNASWANEESCKFGKCLFFDGETDYITVTDSSSIDASTGVTLQAWIRTNTLNTTSTLIEKDSAYSLDISQGMPRFRAYANSVWHTVQATGRAIAGGVAGWLFREPADGTLTGSGGATFTPAFGYRSLAPSALTSENGILITQSDNLQYSRGSQSTPDGTNVVYENFDPNQGTLEFWVRPNWDGDDGGGHIIFNVGNNPNIMNFYYSIDSLRLYIVDKDYIEHRLDYDVSSWTAGTWYHVVSTWDFNNDSMILYEAGSMRDDVPTNALSSDSVNAVESNFNIGHSDGTVPFNGTIAGRILNRAITADEVTALYNSGAGHTDTFTVTPSTVWMGTYSDSTTTAAYWHTGKYVSAAADGTNEDQLLTSEGSDNSFTDNDRITVYDGTGYKIDGCVDGTPTSTSVFIDDCSDGDPGAVEDVGVFADLDGDNQYFNGGDVLRVGTNDFSLSVWVKISSSGDDFKPIIDKLGWVAPTDRGYRIYYVNSLNRLYLTIYSDAGNGAVYWTSVELHDGKWHHIAVTADRDANAILYIDGVSKGTKDISGFAGDSDNTSSFLIGHGHSGTLSTSYFKGSIRDVRIATSTIWSTSDVLNQATHPFNYTTGGTYTSYWEFIDASVAANADGDGMITDGSGSGNHLDAVGGTTTNYGTHSRTQEALVSKNLIQDGSMENGGIGAWTTDPDATTTKDTSVVKFDNQSLKIENIQAEAVYASTTITTADGEDYYFHGWFRTPATVSTSTTLVDVEASSSMSFLVDNLSTSTTAQIAPSTWYEVDFAFQVNDASTIISLGSGSVTATEIGYWDNVSISRNLVDNPGMEGTYDDESSGGETLNIAPGWNHSSLVEHDGTDSLDEEGTIVHSGSKSQKVVVNGNQEGITRVGNITANTYYTFSVWARGGSGGESFTLQVAQFGNNEFLKETLTTSWQKYSLTWNPGADGVGNLYIFSSPGGGTYYFDDVSLIRLDTTPASTVTPSTEANSFNTGKWDDSNGAFLVDGLDILTYSTSQNISATAGTIAMWVKPQTASTTRALFSAYTSGSDYLSLSIDANNFPTADIDGVTVTGTTYTSVADNWYHLVMTYTNGGNLILYVNGTSEGTPTGYSSVTLPVNFEIGGENSLNIADSYLDDIRIYNTVLTATEISDLYAGTFENVINENEWSHLSGVYNKSDEDLKIYVDGILKKTTDAGGSYDLNNSSDNLVIGEGFSGYMDNIKVFDEARTASQIRTDYTGAQTSRGASGRSVTVGESTDSAEGLIAHYTFDETALNACGTANDACDSSGNNNHLSAINDASPTSTAKYGYAATFDGTGDYYCSDPDDDGDCDDDDDLDFGSSDNFTASLWFKTSNSAQQRFFQKYNSSGYLFFISAGAIGFTTHGTVVVNITYDGSYDDGEWHYAVGVRNQTDGKLYLYVDGIERGSVDEPIRSLDNSGNLIIGARYDASTNFMDGQIDDVKIYNVARSASQIRKDYETGPPPVAHWKFDENAGDSAQDTSGTNTGTLGSGAGSDSADPTWTTGKYGSAFQFDGVDDIVSIPNSTSLGITGSMSVSVWFYPTAVAQGLIEKGNLGGGIDWMLYISGSNLYFYHRDAGTNTNSTTIQYNVWNHAVGVFDGDFLYLYFNGVLVGEFNTTATVTPNDYNTITIGSAYSNRLFNGAIDDVRIYNYARTQKQIMQDMNAGHPAVGSPVGSYVGYWKFDEGYGQTAYDMSVSSNNGTLGTSTAVSGDDPTWTQSGKFGIALSFDGDENYIDVGDMNSLDGISQFTIGAWINADTITSADSILSKSLNSTNRINIEFQSTADPSGLYLVVGQDGNTYGTTLSNIISTGNWYYLTMVFDGTKTGNLNRLKFFLDGVEQSLTYGGTIPATTDDNSATVKIGYDPSGGTRFFDGKIDEVKIYPFVLTPEEVKQEYNHGQTLQLGSLSAPPTGGAGTGTSTNSSSIEYCVPGGTDQCDAPVAHWKMDENTGSTVYDTSGSNDGALNLNSASLSATSTAWQPSRMCHSGSCLEFDGVDDYVDVSDIDTPDSITVEGWFNFDVLSNSAQKIMIRKNDIFTFDHYLTDIRMYIWGLTDPDATYAISNLNAGTWYHIVGTYSKDNVKLYVNGVNVATGGASSEAISTNNNLIAIGRRPGTSYYFDGKIDDVRIYNYARTPAQIAWDYNRGAPIGWWKMDEGQDTATTCDATGHAVYDYSGNGNTGDFNSLGSPATTTSWVEGKYSCALDFDGTDDYVDMGNDSIFLFNGGGDFTVSAWFNGDAVENSRIVSNEGALASNEEGFGLLTRTANSVRFVIDYAGAGRNTATFNVGDYTGAWHHILGVRDGGNMYLYYDGILRASDTILSDLDTTENLFIGGMASYNEPFNGTIDDVRIYNYALTETQIKNVYNEGSAVRFGPSSGLP